MKKRTIALLTALLMLALLTGCGSSAKMAETEEMEYGYTADSAVQFNTSMSEPQEEAIVEEEVEAPMAAEPDGAVQTPQSLSEKIIYSGYVYLQTTAFDDALAQLEAAVSEYGGFIQSSGVDGNCRTYSDGTTEVTDRWANYVVRVPAQKFEHFMTMTGELGNVTNSSRSAENVTSQYTDYEARLSSLTIQEQRLLSMLEATADLESLIALEARLSEVRYEIEQIERNLRNLDQRLAYSTVTLEIREVEIYTPTAPVTRTFGEKLGDAFSDAWTGLVRGSQNFVLFLAESVFTLVILAAITVVVVLWIRRSIRKRRAKKASSAEE